MRLSKEILDRIKADNIFSLNMAKYISQKTGEPIKQLTIERQAERASDRLLLPACLDFYKSQGYTEQNIFEQPSA